MVNGQGYFMLQNPVITQRNLPILSIMNRNAPGSVQRTPGVHRTIATMVDTRATTCNMK
jgi:hypothetical protein